MTATRFPFSILVFTVASLSAAENPREGSGEISFSLKSRPPLPEWVLGVRQEGGRFSDSLGCWVVDGSSPADVGKLAVELDRKKLTENLALGVVFEDLDNAAFVVQLLDKDNQVVAVDPIYHLIFKGKDAKTDTCIFPLKKYPKASKVAIQRRAGSVHIYGHILCPVVEEIDSEAKIKAQLVRLFGDPLSPNNSLQEAMELTAQKQEFERKTSPPAQASPTSQNATALLFEAPIDNALVRRAFTVRGRTPKLPPGHHLWLVEQVMGFYFPKAEVKLNGESWQAPMREDGEPPGRKFFLSLYDVDEEAHANFSNYRDEAKAKGVSPGLRELPGAERLDRIRLRLEPD